MQHFLEWREEEEKITPLITSPTLCQLQDSAHTPLGPKFELGTSLDSNMYSGLPEDEN